METMKTAEKLQQTLGDRGISQSELARRIGVPQSRINKIVNEKGEMYADQAFAIARALGVSVDWLLDEENDDPLPPVPGERERQVREIIERKGWEWVYWRLIDAQAVEEPLRPTSPTYRETKEAARKMSEQLKEKLSEG